LRCQALYFCSRLLLQSFLLKALQLESLLGLLPIGFPLPGCGLGFIGALLSHLFAQVPPFTGPRRVLCHGSAVCVIDFHWGCGCLDGPSQFWHSFRRRQVHVLGDDVTARADGGSIHCHRLR
jgi:hypothetical protein